MRKIILLIALIFSSVAFAQGNYGGKKTLGLSYMGVDKGYGANLNYHQFVGSNSFGYRFDLDYSSRDMTLSVYEYSYKTDFQRYHIGSAITYSFEKWIQFPFDLQSYAGALYGQEKINNGKSEIDNIPYTKPNANVFGAYVGLELEVSIHRRFTLAITAKNSFTNSKVQKSVFNYGFGIKYNLNDY